MSHSLYFATRPVSPDLTPLDSLRFLRCFLCLLMSHAVVGVSVAKLSESRKSSAPAVTTSRLALTVLDAVSTVLLGVEFSL